MTPGDPREDIRRAIALVEAATDGADDDDIGPTEMAEAVRDALEAGDDLPPQARKFLTEALDGISDGMPGDYVAMGLYAALGVLTAT